MLYQKQTTNVLWQMNHSSEIKLDEDEVHIWSISCLGCKDDISTYMDLLHVDELERVRQFKFPIHKKRFIIIHAALRYILAKYILLPPKSLIFDYTPEGKPYFKDYLSFHFNLSHSHELALCAISNVMPVGIDIEYLKADVDETNIAKYYFSLTEQSILNTAPKWKKRDIFFSLWTLKEAVLKAIGKGLMFGLDQFSFNFDEDGKIKLHSLKEELSNDSWLLRNFEPALDYIAAVASPRQYAKFKFFMFSFE